MTTDDRANGSTTEVATLGGGCFWCLEAVYQELRGVEKVESGYSGGDVPNPTYRQVCSETTGHAEVVQVTFDPDEVSYKDILEVYFTIHDPTTLNRQGADVGTQYRSVIFYHDEDQKRAAEEVISPGSAEEEIRVALSPEPVPTGATEDRVAPGATGNVVGSAARADEVIAAARRKADDDTNNPVRIGVRLRVRRHRRRQSNQE